MFQHSLYFWAGIADFAATDNVNLLVGQRVTETRTGRRTLGKTPHNSALEFHLKEKTKLQNVFFLVFTIICCLLCFLLFSFRIFIRSLIPLFFRSFVHFIYLFRFFFVWLSVSFMFFVSFISSCPLRPFVFSVLRILHVLLSFMSFMSFVSFMSLLSSCSSVSLFTSSSYYLCFCREMLLRDFLSCILPVSVSLYMCLYCAVCVECLSVYLCVVST